MFNKTIFNVQFWGEGRESNSECVFVREDGRKGGGGELAYA